MYNFANLKTAEEYVNAVPLSDFDTYSEYIDHMKLGKNGFITSQPPLPGGKGLGLYDIY
jgi:hypothetical protein